MLTEEDKAKLRMVKPCDSIMVCFCGNCRERTRLETLAWGNRNTFANGWLPGIDGWWMFKREELKPCRFRSHH